MGHRPAFLSILISLLYGYLFLARSADTDEKSSVNLENSLSIFQNLQIEKTTYKNQA